MKAEHNQRQGPEKGKDNDEVYKKIANKWDNHKETFVKGGAWHQHPLVIQTYNERIQVGRDQLEHYVQHHMGFVVDDDDPKLHCLSIGCGDGNTEINMVKIGLCSTMKGIDLSSKRIDTANANIPDYLKDRITFVVENAEAAKTTAETETTTTTETTHPRYYDLILFSHSLHHVFNLESMADKIKTKLLHPTHGIIVLEEYVGPKRWQFSKQRRKQMSTILQTLENKYPTYQHILRQNPLWDFRTPKFKNVNPKSVEQDDPSETIRSYEIIPVLSEYFDLVVDVPLGGNYFQWIFHNAYNGLMDADIGKDIVQYMLNEELNDIHGMVDSKTRTLTNRATMEETKKNHKQKKLMQSDYVFQIWKQRPRLQEQQ